MRSAGAPLLLALALAPWLVVSARDIGDAERLATTREATATIGEIISASALYHRTPRPGDLPCPGAAGPTPPRSLDCNLGEDRRCRPRDPGQPGLGGTYPAALWLADEVWSALGVRPHRPSAFHFSAASAAIDPAAARCRVEVTATADLDGDGRWSTIRGGAELGPEAVTLDPRWLFEDPLE